MQIRRLASSDNLRDVAQVYVRSWQDAYRGIVPQAYLDALASGSWMATLAGCVDRTWAVYEGGAVVGVCTYGPARDKAFTGWGEVVSIYVLPEWAGKGIGHALLEAALGSLRDEGFHSVYLWVLEDNHRARTFYERQGFAPNGDVMDVEVGGAFLRDLRYVKQLA